MAERLLTVDAVLEKYCISNNKIKSLIYQSLGLMFTIFALIGIFVPGWPTVSWAVPAAFLFSLSNENLIKAAPCLITSNNESVWQHNETISVSENGFDICSSSCTVGVEVRYLNQIIKGMKEIELQ